MRVSRTRNTLFGRSFLVAFTLLLAGCSPSLAPLYQDFAVEESIISEAEREGSIRSALEEAGWTLTDHALAPATATERRTFRNWGLYRVRASLEVVPLGGQHVRVLIHPYREYVWGRQSKLPYLSRSLRRAIIPDLSRAFAAHGLRIVER